MATTPAELALKCGINRSYAWQLLNDPNKSPSLELALRIYDETGLQLGLLKGLKADEIQVMRKAAA